MVTGSFLGVHRDRAGVARHRNILLAVAVALLPLVGEVDMRRLPYRGMDSVVVAVVDSLDKKSAMAGLQRMIREAPGWWRKMVCAWLGFRVVAVCCRTCMYFTGTFRFERWIRIHKMMLSTNLLEFNRDNQVDGIATKINATSVGHIKFIEW